MNKIKLSKQQLKELLECFEAPCQICNPDNSSCGYCEGGYEYKFSQEKLDELFERLKGK